MFGQRQHVERRLVEQRQRALGAAQDAVEIEAAFVVGQMCQIVAGQTAVERRKRRRDALPLGSHDVAHRAVDLTDPVVALAGGRQCCLGQRPTLEPFAAGQHDIDLEHVVARLAVFATALAAGIGGNHAANRGAVGGGKLRGEEQSMGLERGVELILDHAGLNPHPAVLDVDLEDPVHVTGDIHYQPVGQRLAVGAGAAAARGEHDVAVRLASEQAGDQFEIGSIARIEHRHRQALVNGVVRRQHGTVGGIVTDVSPETRIGQLGKKPAIALGQGEIGTGRI